MSPEEAENFYEDDEDPQEIFAKFDSGGREVACWQTEPATQICWGLGYIRSRYGGNPDARGRYEQGGFLL